MDKGYNRQTPQKTSHQTPKQSTNSAVVEAIFVRGRHFPGAGFATDPVVIEALNGPTGRNQAMPKHARGQEH